MTPQTLQKLPWVGEIFDDRFAPEKEIADAIETEIRRFAD